MNLFLTHLLFSINKSLNEEAVGTRYASIYFIYIIMIMSTVMYMYDSNIMLP
jgi:hypothetical protein